MKLLFLFIVSYPFIGIVSFDLKHNVRFFRNLLRKDRQQTGDIVLDALDHKKINSNKLVTSSISRNPAGHYIKNNILDIYTGINGENEIAHINHLQRTTKELHSSFYDDLYVFSSILYVVELISYVVDIHDLF